MDAPPARKNSLVSRVRNTFLVFGRGEAFCHLLDLAKDEVRILGPDERSRVGIVTAQELLDGPFQFLHTSERSPPDAPLRDLGEETLHLVQPRRTGWREMRDELGVLGKPCSYPEVLVRAVVV